MTYGISTPKELRQFFENIVDDEPNIDLVYQKLSQAKDRIEVMHKPPTAIKVDETQTANPGDTYLTEKDLGQDSDNDVIVRQMLSLYVDTTRYFPAPFDQRVSFRSTPRRFFINHKDGKFSLSGSVASAKTIKQTFLMKTPHFNQANEDTSLESLLYWPLEFAPIIAYEAAGYFQEGMDADSIAIRQGQTHQAQARELLDAFIMWIADSQVEDIGNATGYAEEEMDVPFDVGSLA